MANEPGSSLFLDLANSCFVFSSVLEFSLSNSVLLISLSYGAAPVNLNIKTGGRAYGSSGKKIYTELLVFCKKV